MRLFKEYFETMKRNTNCLRENLRLSEEVLQLRREMREVDEEVTQLKANCLEAIKGTKELAYELSQENKALRVSVHMSGPGVACADADSLVFRTYWVSTNAKLKNCRTSSLKLSYRAILSPRGIRASSA